MKEMLPYIIFIFGVVIVLLVFEAGKEIGRTLAYLEEINDTLTRLNNKLEQIERNTNPHS